MNGAPLSATLVRGGAFFAFASAYWAMLPLIARQVLDGGPTLYGILLASVGWCSRRRAETAAFSQGAGRRPDRGGRDHWDRYCPRGLCSCPEPGHSSARVRACWCELDRGALFARRLGPDGTTGLGAGARPFHLPHRRLRRNVGKQPSLGPGRERRGHPRCASGRHCRSIAAESADLACEARPRGKP